MGNEYSEMHILDLEATWEESEPRTPLVCILSIGSDPTTQIGALSKAKNIRKYFCIRIITLVYISKGFKITLDCNNGKEQRQNL